MSDRKWYNPASWFRRSEDAFSRPSTSGRSGYKAGRSSRRNDGWNTGATGPNSAVGGGLQTMRERSRDLNRNNDYAHSILINLASHVALVYPQSNIQPRREADGSITSDERERVRKLNKRVDEVFAAWSDVCMTDGPGSFLTAQSQAVLGMFESGETFTRRRVRRVSDGLPVPLQLQLLEADYCDHTLTQRLETGGVVQQGVEFDPIGRRRGFHLHRMHPGDELLRAEGRETVFVPLEACAQLYAKPFARPGQARGLVWLHAVVQKLLDYGGLEDAELVRARGAASLMAIVKGSEAYEYADDEDTPPGINPLRESDGTIVERLRPGTVAYAEEGQSVEFNTPPAFTGFRDQAWTQLHAISSGAMVPFELMTGDLSGTNFSSLMYRMGPFWLIMRRLQYEALVPLWCAPIWRWFVELGVLTGALPRQAGPVRWVARPFPMVDPMKQNKGKLIAVRSGAETLDDWIAETGKDPDEVLATHESRQAWAAERGVVLDGLPNTTTLAGQLQDVPGDEPAPQPDEDDEPDEGEGDESIDADDETE